MRIIITEEQLKEMEDNDFEFLDTDNSTPYNVGNSQIGVTGKTDRSEFGEPATGDKIGSSLTNQGYNRFMGCGRYVTPLNIHESDDDNDGFEENDPELDRLSNGNDADNLMRVPQSAEQRLNNLINVIQNLSPKQQAMVLNKLVETIKLDKIPYSWAKELMFKINSRKNVSQ